MKRDYSVQLETGDPEYFDTLKEAKRYASKHKDESPFIDESNTEDGELTGRFWRYVGGKLVIDGGCNG